MTSIVAQEAGRPTLKLKFPTGLPSSSGGLTTEQVDDRIAALLTAGDNITLTYNDVANTLTIASTGGGGGLTTEQVDDRVAALLTAGSNITLTYDDVAGTLTIAAASGGGGGLTTEQVDDRVAALLTAGSNVTLSYDDTANTLTISAGESLTTEDVDDRVATLLQAGSNVTLTYDDVAGSLIIASGAGAGINASSEVLINGKLVASVASNILTVRLKTWANADPSGGDPVYIVSRKPDGTSVLRTITSALSVTANAGNALNAVSGIPFRIWVSMLDTAGTMSMFLTNASPASTGGLVSVNDHLNPLIVSRVLGYMDWNSGLTTAGQWNAAPNVTQAFGPGVKLPGEVIQSGTATCTGILNVSSTSATNVPGLSVTLQPTSPCNRFNCILWGSIGTETGPTGSSFAATGIRRGGALITSSEALIGHAAVANITTGGAFAIFGTDAPGVSTSQQWTGTIRSTASGNDSFFLTGGILSITEIMG